MISNYLDEDDDDSPPLVRYSDIAHQALHAVLMLRRAGVDIPPGNAERLLELARSDDSSFDDVNGALESWRHFVVREEMSAPVEATKSLMAMLQSILTQIEPGGSR